MPEKIVYLSLGSNMGDAVASLQEAIGQIEAIEGVEKVKRSSLYVTKPIGYVEQDDFYNTALSLSTTLSAHDLLDHLQEIELALGRTRTIRWGPRTLDIDIILYGQEKLEDHRLTIPHPRAHERAFVLIPLLELSESLVLDGRPLQEWLKDLPDQGVRKVDHGKENINW